MKEAKGAGMEGSSRWLRAGEGSRSASGSGGAPNQASVWKGLPVTFERTVSFSGGDRERGSRMMWELTPCWGGEKARNGALQA